MKDKIKKIKLKIIFLRGFFNSPRTRGKALLRKEFSVKHLKSNFIFLLVLFFVFTAAPQLYAQSNRAAIIQEYNGGGSSFRIRQNANSNSIPIEEININSQAGRIEEYGGMSVPNDGESWASFRFETAEEYGGLIISTRPNRRQEPSTTDYIFPCTFRGQLIIAWPNSTNARTCDNSESGRIQIITDPENVLSSSNQIDEQLISSSDQHQRKQNTTDQTSSDLFVSPGSGATVIRTTARLSTEHGYRYFVERCDDNSIYYYCHRSERVIVEETEVIGIEVMEGDILVESDKSPEGVRVRKGERYSYPSEELSEFDVGSAAFSCETVRFLNPANWLDPSIPQNIASGIADQLKEHRDALGISGRPPNNLTELENYVVDELNSLRTSPNAYAGMLEGRRQFYYENWLELPGEDLAQNVRVSAVNEAIDFLRSQTPLPPLSVSSGMSRASQDHVDDQGSTGKYFGHTGDDGSGYWDRLARYGTVRCGMHENVSYFDSRIAEDTQTEAQIAVVELLISDGQRQAGERDNIFNPEFQVMGVACGPHGDFLREMCDITYAAAYLENT
ncbi:MAG: CAP domain-containing protein [Cyanobacteria bacterium P01_D01_bin.56]